MGALVLVWVALGFLIDQVGEGVKGKVRLMTCGTLNDASLASVPRRLVIQ